MRSSKYFLYECYADGALAFLGFSKNPEQEHPIPRNDDRLKKLQNDLRMEGKKLTYSFIEMGLSRAAAVKRLSTMSHDGHPKSSADQ